MSVIGSETPEQHVRSLTLPQQRVLIWPVIWMLAATALISVAILDISGSWLGLLSAGLGLAALTLALPHGSKRRFLLMNLALLFLFGWSLSEQTSVQLGVQGDRLQARAGGGLVQARDSRLQDGGVAVWLAGSGANRPNAAMPMVVQEHPWLAWLLGPSYEGYRGGVSVRVLGPDGAVLVDDVTVWQEADDVTVGVIETPLRDLELRAAALRMTTPYGLLARQTPDREAYRLLARPESRDLSLQRIRDGRLVQELENRGSPYRVSLPASVQSLLRELGRTWLFGLLLVAGVGAVAAASRMARLGGHRQCDEKETSETERAGTPAPRVVLLGIGILAGLAIGAAAWIALIVFEGVPHDRDSVAYLFQARLFAHGVVVAPVPPLPEFFKEDFIITHEGRWFGKYPPGHPLALAIGIAAGVPWAVNPLLAGVAVGLLGLLGWRLFSGGVGLLSALLLITSPFFLFMSGSYMAHPTALALTLAALIVAAPTPVSRRTVLTGSALGLSLGLLVLTRQLTGVALGACLLTWWALDPARSLDKRARLLLGAAAGGIVPLLFLLWFQQVTTGSPLVSPQTLWWDFDRIGFGPGIGADGAHDPASGLHDTWDRLTELQRHLFGWPFYLTLAPAMIPFVTARSTKRDWWLLSVVVTVVGAYVLYWNRGMAYGPRYFYEAIGPLCLLSVRGFAVLSSLAREAPNLRLNAPAGVAAGTVLTALVIFNVAFYLPGQVGELRGYLGVDGRRMEAVKAAGIARGLVFVREEPRGAWQPYASVFWLNTPRLDSPLVFARDRGAEENARLQALYPDRPAFLLTSSGVTPMPTR